MAKLRVGLLFGGRSVEHEVSLASATSILKALDPDRYDITLVGVGQDGRWHLGARLLPREATVTGQEVSLPAVPAEHTIVSAAPGASAPGVDLDVIFPIVHGQGGEDGSLQGLLEMAGVPYVGSGVLGSALQMDKEISKRLMRAAGIPVVPWVLVRKAELDREPGATAERALRELEPPLFVKPATLSHGQDDMQEGHFVGVGVAKYFDCRVHHAGRRRRYGDALAEAVLAAGHGHLPAKM